MVSRVRVTANFQRNLDSIQEFLVQQECEGAFDGLLARLFDDIIPNLERFPRMGRDFLARQPQSGEGRGRLHDLMRKTGNTTEIREYITDSYLIIYAVRGAAIFLLSIRHHRQLSFDLRAHWL